MYLGLSYFQLKNLDKSIYYLSQIVSQTNDEDVYATLTTAYETTKNYICALNTVHLSLSLAKWMDRKVQW